MKIGNKGQLFLEVLISLLVLSIILVGVLNILSLTPKIVFFSEKNQTISSLLNEYMNIALSFRYKYDDIKNLSSSQDHYFEKSQDDWAVHTNAQETIMAEGNAYKRYFRIANYSGSDSKLMTIYLSSTSTTESLQIIITEWQQEN
ncbi:MAG: hypothetical protein AAB371_00225 [Patescibacteria group bacterium]